MSIRATDPSSSLFGKLWTVLREDGLSGGARRIRNSLIARVVWRGDRAYDARYGIDTAEGRQLHELAIDSPNLAHGVEYAPTPVYLWTSLTSPLPKDLSEFTFLDYGCGKGRNLLLAAQSLYQEIIGIEFSAELVKIAEANLRKAAPGDVRLNVLIRDAADYAPPDRNLVVYLYNPFGRAVMKPVVSSLEALANSGRKIWVIYYNPQCADLFESSPVFHRRKYGFAARITLAAMSWHKAAAFESV